MSGTESTPRTKNGARMDPKQILQRSGRATGLAFALAALVGCQSLGFEPPQQRFESPELATAAMLDAFERDDQAALLEIFGKWYEADLITPDWDADREQRLEIVKVAREQHEIVTVNEDLREIVIGVEEWPFPFRLERSGEAWQFDTPGGIQEVYDRRVGRNETAAIEILDAYVDAQIEYARVDRDGDGRREYAQKLASTPGQRDGLYWAPTGEGDESPLGPLVARSRRYLDDLEPGDPIRGYYFEILDAQGPNVGLGARSYLVGDDMLTGFAMVAVPAEHGSSGIMTFVVNHRGRIYQKDLGTDASVGRFDPDDTWTVVED